MADNVAITAGSGTTIATDDAGAAGHVQVVKLAISADGSATAIGATADGLEVQGSVAEDAALVGFPQRIGGRAHSGVPTAMSADNDVVTPWMDRSGAQIVVPSIRQVGIIITPGMTAASYTAGEQIGTFSTITGAALATGRSGTILGCTMINALANTVVPELDLFIYEISPTLVGANDAAADITDANLITARPCGVIEFNPADYHTLANNSVCIGTVTGSASFAVPFNTSGSANLFAHLVARSAFTGATNAMQFTFKIAQD